MSFTSGAVLTASALNTFAPGTKITNADGTAGAPSYSFASDTDTGLFLSGTGQVAIATGGSARLTVTSAGKVGIGTSNPSVPLMVATGGADHGILVQSTDSVARINMQDDSSTDAFAVGIGATGDALSLFAGSAEKVRVASNGKVGISTTSPDQTLHVAGATALAQKVVTGASTFTQEPWSNSTIAFSNFGSVGTQGSFKTTLAWNFERGTDSGFHSLAVNSYTSAAAIELGNDGIEFRYNSSYGATSLPTRRAFIGDAFLLLDSGVDYFATSPTTGTGNDAEWVSTGAGTFLLARNSSLTAEKENITADLATHLTAEMIDSVEPKLWNRKHTPGYPEIGPLAEDMDAISPFLAAHGADIQDGTYQQFVTGINKTAYLSLLVLAVKDLRARVATLEA